MSSAVILDTAERLFDQGARVIGDPSGLLRDAGYGAAFCLQLAEIVGVVDPELSTGDSALGFWKAVRMIWPANRQQRCWVHKTERHWRRLNGTNRPRRRQRFDPSA